MNSDLTVTVIITAYNQQDIVSEAVNSVLNQTAFHLIKEIICVDDGSTDETLEILKKFEAANKKLKVFTQPNSATAGGVARNSALLQTKSTLVAFLDGDDAWLPEKIENQVDFLKKNPAVSFVYSDFFQTDYSMSNRIKIKVKSYHPMRDPLESMFIECGALIPSSIIARTHAIQETGVFDPSFQAGEDSDYWLRAAEKGFRFGKVEKPLVLRRSSPNSGGSNTVFNSSYYNLTTKKILSIRPDLSKLEALRNSKLNQTLGIYYRDQGQLFKAAKTLALSIYQNPKNLRAWYYFTINFLPKKYTHALTDKLKDYWHAR